MEEAEAHRIKGGVLLRMPEADPQSAEAAFVKSPDVARSQAAKSCELR
jgi:hypothetical protein